MSFVCSLHLHYVWRIVTDLRFVLRQWCPVHKLQGEPNLIKCQFLHNIPLMVCSKWSICFVGCQADSLSKSPTLDTPLSTPCHEPTFQCNANKTATKPLPKEKCPWEVKTKEKDSKVLMMHSLEWDSESAATKKTKKIYFQFSFSKA